MKLSNIDWYVNYKLWTKNAGVFEYLFKSAPFVSAKYMKDFQLVDKSSFNINEDIKAILKGYVQNDNILIFDISTEEGINLAVALNNDLKVSPILSYNFLFHPYGIVGDNELIENLAGASEIIKIIEPVTYAFILDSSRYRNNVDLCNPMIFNNQYEITEEEMPDIDILRLLNKKSVTFFYRREIKEDIACYLEHLKTNNFVVNTVDLGEVWNE